MKHPILTPISFSGTHIDMPSHFVKEEYKSGNTVEKVDLELLMGELAMHMHACMHAACMVAGVAHG